MQVHIMLKSMTGAGSSGHQSSAVNNSKYTWPVFSPPTSLRPISYLRKTERDTIRMPQNDLYLFSSAFTEEWVHSEVTYSWRQQMLVQCIYIGVGSELRIELP